MLYFVFFCSAFFCWFLTVAMFVDRWQSTVTDGPEVHISHPVTNFEFLYEPFYVAPDTVPPHDERFLGYGYTRNSQVLFFVPSVCLFLFVVEMYGECMMSCLGRISQRNIWEFCRILELKCAIPFKIYRVLEITTAIFLYYNRGRAGVALTSGNARV